MRAITEEWLAGRLGVARDIVREARQLIAGGDNRKVWVSGRMVWIREDVAQDIIAHLMQGSKSSKAVWKGVTEDHLVELGVVVKKPLNPHLVVAKVGDEERRVRVSESSMYGLGMEIPMRRNAHGYWDVARPGPRFIGRW
jgi:hypothetical protein